MLFSYKYSFKAQGKGQKLRIIGFPSDFGLRGSEHSDEQLPFE